MKQAFLLCEQCAGNHTVAETHPANLKIQNSMKPNSIIALVASLFLFNSCERDNGIRQVAENTVAVKSNGEFLTAGKYYNLTDNAKVFPTRATFEVRVILKQKGKEEPVATGIIQNVEVYADFGGLAYVKQVRALQYRTGIQELLDEKSQKEAWTVEQDRVRSGPVGRWKIVSTTVPKEIALNVLEK